FSSIDLVLNRIIDEIAFSALSEVIRDRASYLKNIYYRLRYVISPFSYFCAGALMVSGPTLIGFLYDHRYSGAGWMLQILAAALITSPFRVATVCFLALGLPRLLSYFTACRVITVFV